MASRPCDAMVDVVLDEDEERDAAPSRAPRAQGVPTQRPPRGAPASPAPRTDPDAGEPPGRDAARERGLRLRRRALAVCGAAAALALAVGAVEGARDARDADRLSGLPAFVEPVDDPLGEAWRVETGPRFWTTDALLLRPAADGLVAHELTTGAERWTASAAASGDTLEACVGTADGAAVACRRAGGTVLALDATDGTRLPDGADAPDDVRALAALEDDVVRVTDAWVERVDPRSGAVRWRVAVPEGADPDGLRTPRGLVTFSGDVAAVLDGADGALLGRWPGAEQQRPSGGVAALVRVAADGFGVWVEQRRRFDDPQATWFDRTGTPVGAVEGHLAEPAASDGSAPEVRLTVTDAPVLRAVDRHGDLLWAAHAQDGLPVVRAQGAVVLAAVDVLRSVDLDDGDPRWSVPLAPDDAVTGLSDGRHVVVLHAGTSDRRLVAYALEDGGVAWSTPLAGGLDLLPAGTADVVLARDGTAVVGLR